MRRLWSVGLKKYLYSFVDMEMTWRGLYFCEIVLWRFFLFFFNQRDSSWFVGHEEEMVSSIQGHYSPCRRALLGRTYHIWHVAPELTRSRSWIHERTKNFIEVSGHNLESSQTWGFRIQCLHYKPVSNHCCPGGGGGVKSESVEVTVNNKEENSSDFCCPNNVQ